MASEQLDTNEIFCNVVRQLVTDYTNDKSSTIDDFLRELFKAFDALQPTEDLETAWQKYQSVITDNVKPDAKTDHLEMNDIRNGNEANIPVFSIDKQKEEEKSNEQ